MSSGDIISNKVIGLLSFSKGYRSEFLIDYYRVPMEWNWISHFYGDFGFPVNTPT